MAEKPFFSCRVIQSRDSLEKETDLTTATIVKSDICSMIFQRLTYRKTERILTVPIYRWFT